MSQSEINMGYWSIDQWWRSIDGGVPKSPGGGEIAPNEFTPPPPPLLFLIISTTLLCIPSVFQLLSSLTQVAIFAKVLFVIACQNDLLSLVYTTYAPRVITISLLLALATWSTRFKATPRLLKYIIIPLLMQSCSISATSTDHASPSTENPSNMEMILVGVVVGLLAAIMSGKMGNRKRPASSAASDTPRRFIHRILLGGQSAEDYDHSSSINDVLRDWKQSLEEESFVIALIGYAESISQHWLHAGTNTTALEDNEWLFVADFPPDDQNLHEYGILSTFRSWWSGGTTHRVSEDSLPVNPSVNQCFRVVAIIISKLYGVCIDTAEKVCNQCSVWVDICSITLPFNSGDDGGSSSYNTARDAVDEYSKQYILALIDKLRPNLKYIVVLGKRPFELIQEMIADESLILGDIKIFHSPIIHPTKLLKWGASRREAYWFYQCVSDMVALSLGRTAAKPEWKKVISAFSNRVRDDFKGCFIFKGSFKGNLLFTTRGYTDMRRLINDNEGSCPGTFPLFRDMVNSPTNYIFRGLEIELVWFENHDCTKKFGLHDKPLMEEWVAHSNTLMEEGWKVRAAEGMSDQAIESSRTLASARWD